MHSAVFVRIRRCHERSLRCPFCHEDLASGLETAVRACPSCFACHHAECWREGGSRCAACSTRPPPSRIVRPASYAAGFLRAGLFLLAIFGLLCGAAYLNFKDALSRPCHFDPMTKIDDDITRKMR